MAEGLELNSDLSRMRAVTAANYSTKVFGSKVEAQVVRIRKGLQDHLRSDRGLRLRGIDCDAGSGRRIRVTPRRWRGNVICRAHYGYRIRMQCYLRAQDNASCNH